jgi:hypothetical protein
MKKQLLNLSMVALFLAVGATVFAVHFPPIQTMEIPAAADGITIDGDDDAGYSELQTTAWFAGEGSTGDDADFTGTFKVAYDPTYLYIWFEILDDYDNSLTYTTDANQWTYDNVEVFLDLDTIGSGATPAYDTNTIQLRFNRGLTDSVQTPGRATQEQYIYHFENTASGWIHEVAIPWTCVLGSAQGASAMEDYLGLVHGFDVSCADSDTDGPDERDCQTAWDMDGADGTEDNAWNNRTVFGIVTLQDNDWGDWNYPTSVESHSANVVNAYPNPATNEITFDVEGLNTVEIYSITGVQVMVVETTGTVDISSLNSGLYIARIGENVAQFVVE